MSAFRQHNRVVDEEARHMAAQAQEDAQRALDRLVAHERACSLMWRAVAGALAMALLTYVLLHH